jgi:transcriptional regulator with XRE-family HTH domain
MGLQQVFITNLKRFRKLRGLSQMKLAEQCETSTSYIGEIEIGNKFPSITMVEKLATALQIPAHLLFQDERYMDDTGRTFEASLKPLFSDAAKKEIVQQISKVIDTFIKKY